MDGPDSDTGNIRCGIDCCCTSHIWDAHALPRDASPVCDTACPPHPETTMANTRDPQEAPFEKLDPPVSCPSGVTSQDCDTYTRRQWAAERRLAYKTLREAFLQTTEITLWGDPTSRNAPRVHVYRGVTWCMCHCMHHFAPCPKS
jgi:hypothetical protein